MTTFALVPGHDIYAVTDWENAQEIEVALAANNMEEINDSVTQRFTFKHRLNKRRDWGRARLCVLAHEQRVVARKHGQLHIGAKLSNDSPEQPHRDSRRPARRQDNLETPGEPTPVRHERQIRRALGVDLSCLGFRNWPGARHRKAHTPDRRLSAWAMGLLNRGA